MKSDLGGVWGVGECCMGEGFCENANLNIFSGRAPNTKPWGMPWDRQSGGSAWWWWFFLFTGEIWHLSGENSMLGNGFHVEKRNAIIAWLLFLVSSEIKENKDNETSYKQIRQGHRWWLHIVAVGPTTGSDCTAFGGSSATGVKLAEWHSACGGSAGLADPPNVGG